MPKPIGRGQTSRTQRQTLNPAAPTKVQPSNLTPGRPGNFMAAPVSFGNAQAGPGFLESATKIASQSLNAFGKAYETGYKDSTKKANMALDEEIFRLQKTKSTDKDRYFALQRFVKERSVNQDAKAYETSQLSKHYSAQVTENRNSVLSQLQTLAKISPSNAFFQKEAAPLMENNSTDTILNDSYRAYSTVLKNDDDTRKASALFGTIVDQTFNDMAEPEIAQSFRESYGIDSRDAEASWSTKVYAKIAESIPENIDPRIAAKIAETLNSPEFQTKLHKTYQTTVVEPAIKEDLVQEQQVGGAKVDAVKSGNKLPEPSDLTSSLMSGLSGDNFSASPKSVLEEGLLAVTQHAQKSIIADSKTAKDLSEEGLQENEGLINEHYKQEEQYFDKFLEDIKGRFPDIDTTDAKKRFHTQMEAQRRSAISVNTSKLYRNMATQAVGGAESAIRTGDIATIAAFQSKFVQGLEDKSGVSLSIGEDSVKISFTPGFPSFITGFTRTEERLISPDTLGAEFSNIASKDFYETSEIGRRINETAKEKGLTNVERAELTSNLSNSVTEYLKLLNTKGKSRDRIAALRDTAMERRNTGKPIVRDYLNGNRIDPEVIDIYQDNIRAAQEQAPLIAARLIGFFTDKKYPALEALSVNSKGNPYTEKEKRAAIDEALADMNKIILENPESSTARDLFGVSQYLAFLADPTKSMQIPLNKDSSPAVKAMRLTLSRFTTGEFRGEPSKWVADYLPDIQNFFNTDFSAKTLDIEGFRDAFNGYSFSTRLIRSFGMSLNEWQTKMHLTSSQRDMLSKANLVSKLLEQPNTEKLVGLFLNLSRRSHPLDRVDINQMSQKIHDGSKSEKDPGFTRPYSIALAQLGLLPDNKAFIDAALEGGSLLQRLATTAMERANGKKHWAAEYLLKALFSSSVLQDEMQQVFGDYTSLSETEQMQLQDGTPLVSLLELGIASSYESSIVVPYLAEDANGRVSLSLINGHAGLPIPPTIMTEGDTLKYWANTRLNPQRIEDAFDIIRSMVVDKTKIPREDKPLEKLVYTGVLKVARENPITHLQLTSLLEYALENPKRFFKTFTPDLLTTPAYESHSLEWSSFKHKRHLPGINPLLNDDGSPRLTDTGSIDLRTDFSIGSDLKYSFSQSTFRGQEALITTPDGVVYRYQIGFPTSYEFPSFSDMEEAKNLGKNPRNIDIPSEVLSGSKEEAYYLTTANPKNTASIRDKDPFVVHEDNGAVREDPYTKELFYVNQDGLKVPFTMEQFKFNFEADATTIYSEKRQNAFFKALDDHYSTSANFSDNILAAKEDVEERLKLIIKNIERIPWQDADLFTRKAQTYLRSLGRFNRTKKLLEANALARKDNKKEPHTLTTLFTAYSANAYRSAVPRPPIINKPPSPKFQQ